MNTIDNYWRWNLMLWIPGLCLFLSCATTPTNDWPMWRYDANRSAASPHALPDEMNLQWVREFSPRKMTWDDPLNHDLMPYDRVFEPVVMGSRMFVGFNDSDKVLAIDTESGETIWTYYTDGPVRFPPVASNGNVYFSSDDGYLYCVRANNGRLLWKFRGGPADRKIIGNERLISTWPARGGPVLQDGVVYFAASIWPFMGTFIYALDADSGDMIWVNDGNGSRYMKQPHNAPSFAGVAPQGAMVIAGDKLLVPGGRSVPAVFDRNTGDFLYYRLHENNKTGGSFVTTDGNVFFNHHREKLTTVYDVSNGDELVEQIGRFPVVHPDVWYTSGESVTALDAKGVRNNPEEWQAHIQWELPVDASQDLMQAGNHLYAAGEEGVTAITLPQAGGQPTIAWSRPVDGQVERLIAADNKLFAVTLDGRILAFGPGPENKTGDTPAEPPYHQPSAEATGTVHTIVEQTGVTEGYAVLWGAADEDLLEALLQQTKLHVIAVEPNASQVARLRQVFDARGTYGKRLSIHQGTPDDFHTPPYMASLTIINNLDAPATTVLQSMLNSMRPYGGKLWVHGKTEQVDAFANAAKQVAMHGLNWQTGGSQVMASRDGALPGAGSWTHQYGDIANTTKSDDQLVKLPLGILWFGGSSNLDVLPRHGHGPPEQVIGGRLFIEGMESMSARDVYTGQVLWQVPLDSLGNYGVYFGETFEETPTSTAYNQVHIPGANSRGSNYVATEDRVYVVHGSGCTVLDAVTGRQLQQLTLPPNAGGEHPEWGYIGVTGDYLIAGADFVMYSDLIPKDKLWKENIETLTHKKRVYTMMDKTASKALVVMNRHTGEVLWRKDARYGLLHNTIAVGGGSIYCLDKYPPHIEEQLERRGKALPQSYTLQALDLQTGKQQWQRTKENFGSWLSYSGEHDVLVQSNRPSRDMLVGERGERMTAYNAGDGRVLWNRTESYKTFPILHGDKIITEGALYNLLTGEPLNEVNPITRETVPWSWKREYGCNYPIASEHMLTFRSGAAGYYDMAQRSGTGNIGGFKSGCTSNLVVADGVLNAPDYTRTCSCAYQNQTSLALIHMPEAETWTYSTLQLEDKAIKRLGINLGAPGDHMDEQGTLWLEYPVTGGPSPEIDMGHAPESSQWFRRHTTAYPGEEYPWVVASGVVGLRQLTIPVNAQATEEIPYRVRLFFAESEDVRAGDRVFDVTIQSQKVLSEFDILQETVSANTTVVKEFSNILVSNDLQIELQASSGEPVLCGVEIIAMND
jgi:outer membrane protein assembly factor BamB